MAKYEWKKGARLSGNAQQVGRQLESIRKRNAGHLTPEMVVNEAQQSDALLHQYFEWDNHEAADKYREVQAGHLIRAVVVIVEPNGRLKETRAFVSVTRDEGKSYTSIAHAMSDDELREQVVRRARKELQTWRERYADYQELSSMFTAIDKAA